MTQPPLTDIAVVLAAHGDRGGAAPNATLLAHAKALTAMGVYRCVAPGTLKSDDLPLELALDEAKRSQAQRIAVYPMFMADGYFTGTVLPDRIAAAGLAGRCTLLSPLGLDPKIPELMLADALATAARKGLKPIGARLLIAGHGSKISRASYRATERVASALRRMEHFAKVDTAYLEEDPLLEAQLSALSLPTIVAGFFSGDGMHAAEDVPRAIQVSGAAAFYCGAVSQHRQIPNIIHAAVQAGPLPAASA